MVTTSMDLELRHLRLVQAIAEEGGMTRAAHRLHLTQSALSHQLRIAEEQVRASLFTRLPRKMSLTPAGERLLQTARAVFSELDEAERDLHNVNHVPRSVIRLATQCYTVYHWLPRRILLFEKRYPGAEIRVVGEATRHPFEALHEGKLDLAIVCNPIRDRRIEYVPLFEDELVVIVSPEHRLARQQVVEPHDLADETAFIYPPRKESTFLNRILLPAGVMPKSVQEIELTEAIIELVKGGLGVAALARWAVAPHLKAGTLRALTLKGGAIFRQWSAARLRRGPDAPHLDAFVELLREYPISEPLSRSLRVRKPASFASGMARKAS